MSDDEEVVLEWSKTDAPSRDRRPHARDRRPHASDPLGALRAVAAEVADELDRRGGYEDLAARLHGAVDGELPRQPLRGRHAELPEHLRQQLGVPPDLSIVQPPEDPPPLP